MKLTEQFIYDDFCLRFAHFVFPMIGADEIAVKGWGFEKLYRKCSNMTVIRSLPKHDSKAELSYMVGSVYEMSYTRNAKEYKLDVSLDSSLIPLHTSPVLHIVTRKLISLRPDDVVKKMQAEYKANVLYLIHYKCDFVTVKELREQLFKNNIMLVMYYEIDAWKPMLEGEIATGYSPYERKFV